MGEFYDEISENHAEWIKKQKIFFVGTSPLDPNGKVNLSPKGYDCFRIIGPNQVCYLELTGSGIETQSHVEENKRITIMLCAFEGAPRIMRLFGIGTVHRVGTSEFNAIFSKHYTSDNCDIHDSTGKRSIIVVDVYKVGSSCGYGVPFYDYKGSRPTLTNYWSKKPAEQVAEYWVKKNTTSLDGLPGMRHERMGDRWTMLSGEDRKKLNWFKDANGDHGRWWDVKYLMENASSVAVGAGIGTVVGAAVATVLFMNKRA